MPKSGVRELAWLSVSFSTQLDSIFWDSTNNGDDRFFIHVDSSGNMLQHFVSRSAQRDSACLLLPTGEFFRQQFGGGVPYFSAGDSIVKIRLKVKAFLDPDTELATRGRSGELEKINAYFGSSAARLSAADPSGFYWLSGKPAEYRTVIRPGDRLRILYHGSFLNGRPLDEPLSEFEFIYGTPDQVLEGINNVIPLLQAGETAKIMLPSRLAFGESGSSDGMVPPFTPLIYQVKIIEIKRR